MLLKIPEVARLLNVAPSCVYAYVARGMPHIRFSPRCIRFEEQDVKTWVEECRSRKTSADAGKSSFAKGESAFIEFVRKAPPGRKRSNTKLSSGQKSSGLTNLVSFPTTRSAKR